MHIYVQLIHVHDCQILIMAQQHFLLSAKVHTLSLGTDANGADMLVVFIEVVATDSPINRERKTALTSLATEAEFGERHLSFLNAFMDRASAPFKKSIAELAWGSYAWCASEPMHIIDLRIGVPRKLSNSD